MAETPGTNVIFRSRIQDVAACVVSLALVFGLIAITLLEKATSAEYGIALGASVTWLFIRSVDLASLEQRK
jgi:hypothetical protein